MHKKKGETMPSLRCQPPKLAFVKLSLNLSKKYPWFFQMYLWKKWFSLTFTNVFVKRETMPLPRCQRRVQTRPSCGKSPRVPSVLMMRLSSGRWSWSWSWSWWLWWWWWLPSISSDDEIIMRIVIPLLLSWRRWIWWCCGSWSWWWSSWWLWLFWWLESWGSWRWRQWQWSIQTSKSSVGVNSQAGTSPQDISRFTHNDHHMNIKNGDLQWPSYHHHQLSSYDHHIIHMSITSSSSSMIIIWP